MRRGMKAGLWALALAILFAANGCTYQRKVHLKRTDLPEYIYRRPAKNDFMTASVAVFNFREPPYAPKMGNVAAEFLHEELLAQRIFAVVVHEAEVSEVREERLVEMGRAKGYDLVITGDIVYFFEGSDHHAARVDERIRVVDVHANRTLWYAKAVDVASPALLVDYAVAEGRGAPAPTTRTLFKRNAEKFARMLLNVPGQTLWTAPETQGSPAARPQDDGPAEEGRFLAVPFEGESFDLPDKEAASALFAPNPDGNAGAVEETSPVKSADEPPADESPEFSQEQPGPTGAENRDRFSKEHVYFELDRARLSPNAEHVLKAKAEWLSAHPRVVVEIQGHCDERGTDAYNIALGTKRADAVKAFLAALGISADRLSTVSYGKERPVDRAHNERAWSRNRRAQFVIIRE